MSAAKHTPGPWRSEYPVIYAASGAKLVTIDEYDCATIYDAPLMAAAPDLLAALQEARDALKLCYDVNWHPANGQSVQDKAIETAAAAIAKATGAAK